MVTESVYCDTLSGYSGYSGQATRTCRRYANSNSNSDCTDWDVSDCQRGSNDPLCTSLYGWLYTYGSRNKASASGWYPTSDHSSVFCHLITSSDTITCAAAAGSNYTNDGQYTEGGAVVTTKRWRFADGNIATVSLDRGNCYYTTTQTCGQFYGSMLGLRGTVTIKHFANGAVSDDGATACTETGTGGDVKPGDDIEIGSGFELDEGVEIGGRP